jgi:hypothetical protein
MNQRDQNARLGLYSYHGGQGCPLHAAASSGMVEDLTLLINTLRDIYSVKDRVFLQRYLTARCTKQVFINGKGYYLLPWYSK